MSSQLWVAADLPTSSRLQQRRAPAAHCDLGACAQERRADGGDENRGQTAVLHGAVATRAVHGRAPRGHAMAAARHSDKIYLPLPFSWSCTTAREKSSSAASRRGRPPKKIMAEVREASATGSSCKHAASRGLRGERSRHGSAWECSLRYLRKIMHYLRKITQYLRLSAISSKPSFASAVSGF